jgi:hypothetical protein
MDEEDGYIYFKGRIFIEPKIISFWKYPQSKYGLNKIISDINYILNENNINIKINNNWLIELQNEDIIEIDEYKNPYSSMKYENKQFMKIEKIFWRTIHLKDDINVYLVDGDYIRTFIDIEYIEGGHYYARKDLKFIPENEIWIEKNLNIHDRNSVLVHEYVERYMMKFLNYDYNKAHNIANKMELNYRKDSY